MNKIILFLDLIAFLLSLAVILLITTRKSRRLASDAWLPVMVRLVVSSMYYVSLILEWSNITHALEPYENLIGAMKPMLWALLFYAIIQDKYRDDLRKSEERFRILVEQASDAMYLCDDKGKIIEINQHACEDTGYSRDELLEMTIWNLDREFEKEELPAIRDRLAAKQKLTLERKFWRKDGTPVPVEIRIGLLEIQGEELYLGLAPQYQHQVSGGRGTEAARTATAAFSKTRVDIPVNRWDRTRFQ